MFAFLGHSACAYETRRGLTANFLVSFPAGSPSSEFSDTSSRTVSKRLCFGYFSLLHPSSHTEVSSFVFLTNQASLDPSCRISYLLACIYLLHPSSVFLSVNRNRDRYDCSYALFTLFLSCYTLFATQNQWILVRVLKGLSRSRR